jgi:hypothetical protein
LVFDFELPEIVLEKLSGECGIPLDAGEFGRNLATVAEGHFKEGNGAANRIKEDAERLETFGEAQVLGSETKFDAATVVLEVNDLESALEFIERDGDGHRKLLHGTGSGGGCAEPTGEGFFGFNHEEVIRRLEHEQFGWITDLPAEAPLGAEPDGAGFFQRNTKSGQAAGLDEIGTQRPDGGLFGNPVAEDGLGILCADGGSEKESKKKREPLPLRRRWPRPWNSFGRGARSLPGST